MSHQKINCQILQRSENNLFCYREITDNNAYSIYNKQKFVCLVQRVQKKNNFNYKSETRLNRLQDMHCYIRMKNQCPRC